MERPLEYIGRKTVENIAFWGHFDLWPSVHSFHCRSSPRCSCWRTANRPRAQRSRVPFKSGQLKRQIKQSNKAKPPQYNHINNHHLLRRRRHRRRHQQQQQQHPHHPQLRHAHLSVAAAQDLIGKAHSWGFKSTQKMVDRPQKRGHLGISDLKESHQSDQVNFSMGVSVYKVCSIGELTFGLQNVASLPERIGGLTKKRSFQ